ncbi:hypothetical protein PENANT_c003G11541 [Penicillium antarcticum]|uniref:Major facilitator superfamily (MFS) profile domain-containing protein n=2 Tax=Penicillium antarcticum TaxID=416450 RepID=A0A1V6QJ72_9EURO|nr:hypothetical protein PENANT_c003G11541 [Penicillium antarcticum]
MSCPPDLEKSSHHTDSPSHDGRQRSQEEIRFAKGEDPKSFSPLYKAFVTWEMSMLAFVGSLGSSIMSPAQADMAMYLNISEQATVLSLSLFVLGYAFGPLIWAPISEVYGRRLSMLPAVFGLCILSIGTAVSKEPASVFITRFIGGVFGSAPISNVSAALGDIYDPRVRGVPMAFYALCVIGGPTLAPIVGAALTANPHLGWRWTEYLEAIIGFAVLITTVFFLPETYAPVLLRRKAQLMRKKTGDPSYWHASERNKMDLKTTITKQLSRPLQ